MGRERRGEGEAMNQTELEERIALLKADLDKAIKARDEVLAAVETDAKYERAHFIRDAAIAVFAALPFISEMTERETFDAVWVEARGLWDAKPEDC
jgi:hypothetical protein